MRKRRTSLALAALLVLLTSGITLPGSADPISDVLQKLNLTDQDAQVAGLRLLEASSLREPEIEFERGIPEFVSVEVPVEGTDVVDAALGYLVRFKDLYLLDDPSATLTLRRHHQSKIDGDHLGFSQTLNGIPVVGAEIAVHIRDGRVVGTNGRWIPSTTPLPIDVEPVATADDARAAASKHLKGEQATRLGDATLVYFDESLLGGKPGSRLAWRFTMLAGESPWEFLVDATTLEVIRATLRAEPHAPSTARYEIKNKRMEGITLFCGFAPDDPPIMYDERGRGRDYPASGDREADVADAAFRRVYDYFHDRHGRHSFRRSESYMGMFLRTALSSPPNAQFNTRCDAIYASPNMATLDVLGHEFAHGVITHSSSNLIYENQSGALNESYADVFAALIDGNWTIGEGSAAGIFRDMSNPPLRRDPDHVLASVSGDGIGLRTLPPGTGPDCATNDCGFVHVNSGIPNKAAFLMSMGGTHHGVTVPAMGRERVGVLAYAMITQRLTPSSQFIDAARLSIDVAADWARRGVNSFRAIDVCSVRNAYASVGLVTPDSDCDGVVDDRDTDDDDDYIPDSRDVCPTVADPRQIDTDRDGRGDACDDDDDNDTIPDVLDNCPLVANPRQENSWGNGPGDACRDFDGDGVFDVRDNCRTTPNRDQRDLDGDGVGDACDWDVDGDGISNEFDNAPRIPNRDQADRDRDRVGDVADNCPDDVNTDQADADRDGVGDRCDPDADNDGVPNKSDNCPLVANRDQADLDGNGIGHACDEGEQQALREAGRLAGMLRGLIVSDLRINPCAPGCPKHVLHGYRTNVSVSLPDGYSVRLLDADGFVVGTAVASADRPAELSFNPTPDAGGKAARQRYALEIIGPDWGDPGKAVPVEITVTGAPL